MTQELIKAIRDVSNTHNAKFLLVLLPQRNFLNGIYDPIIFDSLQSFAKVERIAYLNLYQEMTKYPWIDLFYPEDGHFTPLGANVAAIVISQTIQQMDHP